MHKILPTMMLTITALTMLGSVGITALAATTTPSNHGGGSSSITINVTCNNNQQITKHANSGSGSTAINVNVSCGGGVGQKGDKGDQGEQGLPGLPGQKGDTGMTGATGANGTNGKDATICVVVGNQTCGITPIPSPTNTTSITPPLAAHNIATSHFDTKHFSCTSVGLSPFNCVKK